VRREPEPPATPARNEAVDFPPKSEREIIEESLIPDGTECDFEVIEAKDTVSKKGNDMIALTLRVFRDDGRTSQLRDWLLPSIPMKLLRFCEATGLKDKYDSGSLAAADCAGRAGKLVVGVQKDKTGEYPDQNSIKSYRAPAEGDAPANLIISEEKKFAEADIPF
jgi:hypothetical protein